MLLITNIYKMAFPRHFVVFILQLIFVPLAFNHCNAQGLKHGFYRKTCPNVEAIVRTTTAKYISKAPTLAAPLLRMHFHDCVVRGCDGSILLNSTKDNQAERDALPNQTLRGFQVINGVKSALEDKCPGVVSCADILALVARDVVSMIKGPYWKVPLGRRDGRVSSMDEALNLLPPPNANISSLKQQFASLGLNAKDLVVLSGGHTIGTAHCFSFTDRMYNFTGKGDVDPTMDPNYIAHLKQKCSPTDVTTIVEMDPGSFRTFDEKYYTLVAKRRGLFQSDAALLDDIETKYYVKHQALTQYGSTFFRDFGKSMVKMGKIGVLTGQDGEIRKYCDFVN